MNRDYATIGNWCLHAHGILASDLSAKLAQMRLEIISRHAGKPTIVDVAKDLAEGLSELPEQRRSAAQVELRAQHGFGYDYFNDLKLLRLAKILARGKVRGEREHMAVIDALSDTRLDYQLVSDLRRLLVSYEGRLGAA